MYDRINFREIEKLEKNSERKVDKNRKGQREPFE